MERFGSDGCKNTWMRLCKIDSDGLQFVNRSVYLLMLERPVLLTDPL